MSSSYSQGPRPLKQSTQKPLTGLWAKAVVIRVCRSEHVPLPPGAKARYPAYPSRSVPTTDPVPSVAYTLEVLLKNCRAPQEFELATPRVFRELEDARRRSPVPDHCPLITCSSLPFLFLCFYLRPAGPSLRDYGLRQSELTQSWYRNYRPPIQGRQVMTEVRSAWKPAESFALPSYYSNYEQDKVNL
jgi:hypothetical protein